MMVVNIINRFIYCSITFLLPHPGTGQHSAVFSGRMLELTEPSVLMKTEDASLDQLKVSHGAFVGHLYTKDVTCFVQTNGTFRS